MAKVVDEIIRNFLSSSSLKGNLKIEVWLEVFDIINNKEKAQPGTASRIFKFCMLVLIASTFYFTSFLYIMCAITTVVICLVIYTIFYAMSPNDYHEDIARQVNMIEPLLSVLEDDIQPGSLVSLEIDLNPTLIPKNRKSLTESNVGPESVVKRETYVNDWLELSMVLIDGTKLSFRLTDIIQRKIKTGWNGRRYKSKV